MYFFSKPNGERISSFIETQSLLDFTYPAVGSTRNGEHPSGFMKDHNRIRLGTGRATFEAARRALQEWHHYRFDWIELYRPDTPPEPEQSVGILARASGLWVLNACRIVYVIAEDERVCRFAFGYGTLPEHAESGEERFQVELNRDDDSVWYDILAFSRPHQVLSKLAHPYVRRKQKQFARESKQSMKNAVALQVSELHRGIRAIS